MRELQAEQDLLASLGSSTGELAYLVLHPAANLTKSIGGCIRPVLLPIISCAQTSGIVDVCCVHLLSQLVDSASLRALN